MLAWHTFIDMIHIDHIDPLHNIVVNNDFLKNGIPYPLYMASLPTFNHLLLPTNHTVPTLHLIYLLKMIKTINIIKNNDEIHQYQGWTGMLFFWRGREGQGKKSLGRGRAGNPIWKSGEKIPHLGCPGANARRLPPRGIPVAQSHYVGTFFNLLC